MEKLFDGLFDGNFLGDLLENFDENEEIDSLYDAEFYEEVSNKLLNFKVNNKYLFIFYEEKPYKKIHLHWTKIFLSSENNKFCIKFSKKLVYFDIYFKELENYEKFLEVINKNVIHTNFHEKYKVEKLIGKGGSARVYLIKNSINQKNFAVKAIPKEYLRNQKNGIKSIMNEIEIMRIINHKNIINIEEVQESRNSLYIVTELISGGELLINNKKIKYNDIIHIIKNILIGIKYLNSINIMHRDLKPENILLTKRENFIESDIKIIDLGLATQINLDEFIHKRCGTPGYVAPEILNKKDKKYDEKVDVFSIGIILIILLTGQKVFRGKSFREILKKNSSCEIDFSVLNNNKKLPITLIDLIKLMVKKDPEERISLENTLNHYFFVEYEKNEKSFKSIDNMINPFKLEVNLEIKTKSLKSRINVNDSFVYKKENWNGKCDTLYESKMSIKSKKSFNPKKKYLTERKESIYKYVPKEKESEDENHESKYDKKIRKQSKFCNKK